MKSTFTFLKTTLLGGLVVLLPAYITVLMVLKGLGIATGVLQPVSSQLPTGEHYRYLFAILILLAACFLAGLFIRTAVGRIVKRAVEQRFLERVPGYTVFRGLAEKLSNQRGSDQYTAALAVIEEALVPACIVERHANGICTVFVPSAPTPAMGTIYILPASRVYEVDASLVQIASCVSKWGIGCGELLARVKNKPEAMRLLSQANSSADNG